MSQTPPAGQVAFVLKGYPRLSETFIAQEIHALIERGLDIAIYSLRHPTDRTTHPVHDEISATVNYLPEYLYQEPIRVAGALFKAAHKPGFRTALRTWWRDLRRDPSANRIRRFGQAMVLAVELKPETVAIHAHFLHTPASVARYAALMLTLPWSCSAHAKDIWTTPTWELKEKLAECEWLTTCTAYNTDYLRSLSTKNNISLNYHGVDLRRFPALERRVSERDGVDHNHQVRLLSVGRAVSKKGYQPLLDALARLPQQLHWSFTHIGGGELLPKLKRHCTELGIDTRCRWLGAQPQQTVLEHYRSADLFVLNCTVDDNGDRDGLPNVIVEAQSQSLAVLSTTISGVPELITERENGLLVADGDGESLQRSLQQLITQPQLRHRLGQAGQDKVNRLFDKDKNIEQLLQLFS